MMEESNPNPIPEDAQRLLPFLQGEFMTDISRVRELVNKEDPPEQPYDSKYEAKEILERILQRLTFISTEQSSKSDDSLAASSPPSPSFQTTSLYIAAINCRIGALLVDTEETSAGERKLSSGVATLISLGLQRFRRAEEMEDLPAWSPESHLGIFAVELQNALNYLGMVFSNRNELRTAEKYLKDSESVYSSWRDFSSRRASLRAAKSSPAEAAGGAPSSSDSKPRTGGAVAIMFPSNDTEIDDTLEAHYTSTVFFLAQVYGFVKDSTQSARYCHLTLVRQLHTRAYHPADWCDNCLQLSGYFLGENDFASAEQCILAAEYVIYSGNPPGSSSSSSSSSLQSSAQLPPLPECPPGDSERVESCKANVFMAWGKFHSQRLRRSRDLLMQEEANRGAEEVEEDEAEAEISVDEVTSPSSQSSSSPDAIPSSPSRSLNRDRPSTAPVPSSPSSRASSSSVSSSSLSISVPPTPGSPSVDSLAQQLADAAIDVPMSPSGSMDSSLLSPSASAAAAPPSSASSSTASARFDDIPIRKSRPFRIVREFDDARNIYKRSIDSFESSIKFYALDGFVTEYVLIMHEISSLYKVLAFFEPDLNRKCAMLKRRCGYLEPLVKELNPQAYEDNLKQVCYELGEIYSEIMDLRWQQQDLAISEGYAIDSPDVKKARSKVNEACLQGIKWYDRFFNFYSASRSGDPKVDDDSLTAYLEGQFQHARFFTKIYASSAQEAIANLQKALKGYEFIAEFAKKKKVTEDAYGSALWQQVEMAREMTQLLPLKISNLLRSAGLQ